MNDSFTKDEFWKNFISFDKSSALLSPEKVSIFDTIDSTNTQLVKRLNEDVYSKGKASKLSALSFHKTVFAAAEQTAGHGRLGRTFHSPAKSGIYFSFAYVQEGGIKNPALYTVTSAVCVCRAISRLFSKECAIKWVNDVYLEGKKICGILTEGVTNPQSGSVECVVVGIGINISVGEKIPEALRSKVGGIFQDSSPDSQSGAGAVSRSRLLACCIYEILKSLDSGENVIEEYKSRSMLTGLTVEVHPIIESSSGSYKATVIGINDSASLLVQKEDGSLAELFSGEVSLSLS